VRAVDNTTCTNACVSRSASTGWYHICMVIGACVCVPVSAYACACSSRVVGGLGVHWTRSRHSATNRFIVSAIAAAGSDARWIE
jgi:hypothetical protein